VARRWRRKVIWPVIGPLMIAWADGYALANGPLISKILISVALFAVVIWELTAATRSLR
jgi:hypothetical protein